MAPSASESARINEALRSLYSPAVTLRVGPERREFTVHRARLCKRSEYFDKAFNGNFEEARTGVSILEDVDPKLVKIFIGWLYTGRLTYATDDPDGVVEEDFREHISEDDFEDVKPGDDNNGASSRANPSNCRDGTISSVEESTQPGTAEDEESCSIKEMDGNKFKTWHNMTLFSLFVFADRFGVLQLKNDLTDALCRKWAQTESPSTGSIGFVFSNTTRDSALRKLIVDHLAYFSAPESFSYWDAMPKDLLLELARTNLARLPMEMCEGCCIEGALDCKEDEEKISLIREHGDVPAFTYDMCNYHEHKDDSERDMCRNRRKRCKRCTRPTQRKET